VRLGTLGRDDWLLIYGSNTILGFLAPASPVFGCQAGVASQFAMGRS